MLNSQVCAMLEKLNLKLAAATLPSHIRFLENQIFHLEKFEHWNRLVSAVETELAREANGNLDYATAHYVGPTPLVIGF